MASLNDQGIESNGLLSGELTGLQWLQIGAEPLRVQLLSEPYVIYSRWGYQAVVLAKKSKSETVWLLGLSASSLATQLEPMRIENNGSLGGLEFWLHKESDEKKSKFIISAI